MRKAYYKGFFSLLIGFSLVLFLASCVDLGVENIPQSIDYRSQVKFVNNVPGADATMTIDGGNFGVVSTGTESGYSELASGSRNIVASFSSGPNAERIIVCDTDYKVIVTIVEDSTGARFLEKTLGGYIWE